MSWRDDEPTEDQLRYAKYLAEQLGILDDYDWDNIDKGTTSDLISELKDMLDSMPRGRII